MTYEATDSAISSPASVAGASHCDSPEFPMTDLFGAALAPASRSAPPASSVAATMSATYGLRSSTSSASAALQASLANKLPALLDSRGSIMFALTWKEQVTPLRRRICALRASAHRKSGSGSTGWPTPTRAQQGSGETPEARRARGFNAGLTLMDAATLAAWPTLKSSDADKGVRTHRGAMKELGRKGPGCDLPTMAAAAWQTPQSRDHKGAMNPGNELTHNARPLNEQARLTLGPTLNGSSAAMEKPGQLNAAFSRWLQGYPKVWCEAAIEAWHQMPTKARKGA